MNCCNNTPTMSLTVGNVDSGATPKVEITNHGTPQNTDWEMNITLPATDPTTLQEAKTYTDEEIAQLPLSAQNQLYAHYISLNLINGEQQCGSFCIFFINTIGSPVIKNITVDKKIPYLDFCKKLNGQISLYALASGSFKTPNKPTLHIANLYYKEGNYISCGAENLQGYVVPDSVGEQDVEYVAGNDSVIQLGINAGPNTGKL